MRLIPKCNIARVALLPLGIAFTGCLPKRATPALEPVPDQRASMAELARTNGCRAPETLSVEFANRYDFPSQRCKDRAAALVKRMTLDEKLGQMVQAEQHRLSNDDQIRERLLGSVLSGGGSAPVRNAPLDWIEMIEGYRTAAAKTRLGIPILYGLDAVHGHAKVFGAVVFPHNIGLGASRDAELVERVARATAEELYATNVDWTFAPVLAAARDERWGRTYEAFGETYDLATKLGVAAIRGYQGEHLGQEPRSVLACAKHFIGDGHTTGGVDQGDSLIDDAELERAVLPTYAAAVQAGVGSVMASFSSINGVRMHCNGHLLSDVLKLKLGFDGFVVSDWQAVSKVAGSTYAEQLTHAILAGVDVIMNPKFYDDVLPTLKGLVKSAIPEARIDDATRRILAVKCEMGLMPQQNSAARASLRSRREASLGDFGSERHRALAREAVQKSLVLLKNENQLLPLDASQLVSVHVAGRHANDIGLQSGGWTISWQGDAGPITEGTTIAGGIEQLLGRDKVTVSNDGSGAEGANVGIAVIGETPYAEGRGDRSDLAIDAVDLATVNNLKAAGVPVIVVLVSGRPLLLDQLEPMADALVAAWLPGSEGAGVADVLFGKQAPQGKLSHSWPRNMQQIPINLGDDDYDPLYPFGYGLTYTKTSAASQEMTKDRPPSPSRGE